MQVGSVHASRVLFGAAKPPAPSPKKPEIVVLPLDGRDWQRAFHNVDRRNNIAFHEYVIPPETVKNWTELVTIHEFKGYHQGSTARQLVAGITSQHNSVNVTSTNPNDVEYTASIGPKGKEEYEVSRAFQGEDGLYLLRYVSKKPIEAEKAAAWQAHLRQGRVEREAVMGSENP